RLGPKGVLLGALAVMTVAFALMPLIRTAWEAFAVYTLWGIGSGAFWPSQSALLAGLTPATRRAPAYALQRLAMNVGVALGGVVAGLIASGGGPQALPVLVASHRVTFVGFLLLLPPGPRPAAARGTSRRQLARGAARPGLHALHVAQRRLHDGRDLARRRAPAGLRKERHRHQREGGRDRVCAQRDRSSPLPAPGREAVGGPE